MARPKKDKGNWENIVCSQCGSSASSGYKADLVITHAEVTPDWYVAYDPNIEEYDDFFCSKVCILKYISEALNEEASNERNNGRKEGPRIEGDGGERGTSE